MTRRAGCPSGKHRYRYRDRIGALLALATIDTTDPKRREKRAYKCPRCRGWHLTSKAPRTHTMTRET